jgi:hypothetical protein
MRMLTLVRASSCFVAVACFSLSPVLAGQKGQPAHPTHPAAPVHAKGSTPKPATPVHPAHPQKPSHPVKTAAKSKPATKTTGATPFVTRIENNPQLLSRLQPLLPANTTLANAADGFRNQGQFIAALHVSHNLNIPFTQLKEAMVGPNHLSLGQAIHELRPNANVTSAVKTADDEADADIRVARREKARDKDESDR